MNYVLEEDFSLQIVPKTPSPNVKWLGREADHSPTTSAHIQVKGRFTDGMPCPCRAHVVPLPCRAAKGLECVFPIWFTQCGRVWFTLAMPCPCRAHAMLWSWPFFSKPRHSTAVERRHMGYLPAFGFFRLPRGVPRRLLLEAYQSSQRSIPTTVKGRHTRSVLISVLPAQFQNGR
jgi:hypothetical protein